MLILSQHHRIMYFAQFKLADLTKTRSYTLYVNNKLKRFIRVSKHEKIVTTKQKLEGRTSNGNSIANKILSGAIDLPSIALHTRAHCEIMLDLSRIPIALASPESLVVMTLYEHISL